MIPIFYMQIINKTRRNMNDCNSVIYNDQERVELPIQIYCQPGLAEAPDKSTIQISVLFALLPGWQKITDKLVAGSYQNRFLFVL